MKLLFLGVSSALAAGDKNYQSNMLIEAASGRKILIDCGSDIKHSLHEQGYNHDAIDAVYISHLHADHVGGLEWLGFARCFIDHNKPALYISPDQRDKLWNNVLSGGMGSLENEEATLATYFDVQPVNNLSFTWEKHPFRLIQTPHCINNHIHLPSYGLLIEGDSKTIFLSTDTRFCPETLEPIYNQADLIFHDCETTKTSSGQHARYAELKTLAPAIKNKMWLYDYNETELQDAKRDGFKGYVVLGQSFDF